MEPLVAAVEIDPADLTVARTHDTLDKTYRVAQGIDHRLVFLEQTLITDEIEPPVLGMIEIGETTSGE